MPGFISNTSRQPVATTGESSCLDDGPEGESSEEEGWITPVNLADAHAKFGGAVQEPALGIAVGCVTTDFAMQVIKSNTGEQVWTSSLTLGDGAFPLSTRSCPCIGQIKKNVAITGNVAFMRVTSPRVEGMLSSCEL